MDQRRNGFADNERYEVIGGVVAAGTFARKNIWADGDVIAFSYNFVLVRRS